jgi:hypothetical protein
LIIRHRIRLSSMNSITALASASRVRIVTATSLP